MNFHLDLAEYRDEIDRLRRFAKKLEELGMEDKTKSHKLLIDDLRKRLDKLEEIQLMRENHGKHNQSTG